MEGPNCKIDVVDVYNFHSCGIILTLNSEVVAKLKSRPERLKDERGP